MKKIALVILTGIAVAHLGVSDLHAEESRAAKIKRLQAEAKMAELNAEAAAKSQRAYEEAWKRTKAAAKEAACIAGGLYAGHAIDVACYAADGFKKR